MRAQRAEHLITSHLVIVSVRNELELAQLAPERAGYRLAKLLPTPTEAIALAVNAIQLQLTASDLWKRQREGRDDVPSTQCTSSAEIGRGTGIELAAPATYDVVVIDALEGVFVGQRIEIEEPVDRGDSVERGSHGWCTDT